MYPASPALADGLFTTEAPGNPRVNLLTNKILSVEKTSRSLYFFFLWIRSERPREKSFPSKEKGEKVFYVFSDYC